MAVRMGALAGLPLCLCAFAAGATTWEVRGTATLPASVRIDMARHGQPLWQTTEPGGNTLRETIRDTCGEQPAEVDDFLAGEAMRLNRVDSIDWPLPSGLGVAIPFCLKVERNVAVTAEPGDTPRSILQRNFPQSDADTLAQFFLLNARSFELPDAPEVEGDDFIVNGRGFEMSADVTLVTGVTYILPFASEARLFRRRSESVPDLPQLLARDPAGAKPEPAPIVTDGGMTSDHERYFYDIVESADVESATGSCGSTNPVSATLTPGLLAERFIIEEAAKLAFDDEPAERVISGIIDSGVGKPGTGFFGLELFAPNAYELAGQRRGTVGIDEDGNGHIDDIYGINFNTNDGRIEAYPTTSDRVRPHGSKMAALMLGGPDIATKWVGTPPRPLVRLKVVNFAETRGEKQLKDPNDIDEAIMYLAGEGVSLINMSLTNGQNLLPVSNVMGDMALARVLFVVAAGNAKSGEGRNLDFPPLVFPARYGGVLGDHRRNVITVGAHDASGRKAKFSNYSANFVDLLAPGCHVPTHDETGALVADTGTSPAAAAVSFASALLFSLGLDDANAVKNRLLASVDFDDSLKGTSWSSGRLNILRAISLSADVITLANGGYRTGLIADRTSLNRFCADNGIKFSLSNVRKVIPNLEGPDGPEIEYWYEADHLLSRVRCPQAPVAADEKIALADNQAVDFADVRDVTFPHILPVVLTGQ